MLNELWSVDCKNREGAKESTTDLLFNMAKSREADYLFMGYTGRKGPKQ